MRYLKGQGGLPTWLVLGVLCAYLFTTLPPLWMIGSATFAGIFFLFRAARSEERRVGKSVDLGGRRIIKKKKEEKKKSQL